MHLLLKNLNNEGFGIYIADRLLNDIAKAFEVRERQLRGESAANTADMQLDAQPTNRRINRHKTAANWGNGRLARWQYRASQSPGSSQPLHLSRARLSIPPRHQPTSNRTPEPTNRRINHHQTAA